MSAIGPKQTWRLNCTCPLSGVKRTWPVAGIRFSRSLLGQSGHALLQRKCPDEGAVIDRSKCGTMVQLQKAAGAD
jgi:hypothetical protein